MFLMLGLAIANPDQAWLDSDAAAAAQGWADRIDAGEVSGDLYYNLGNAHYVQGNLPQAIVCWRRGELLSPRDGDILANLDRARRATEDRIETDRSANLLSPKEQGGLAALLIALCGLVGLASRRKPGLSLAIPALITGLPGAALFLATVYRLATFGSAAVILADEIQVRSTGGGGVVLFELHAGAEVLLEQQVGEMSQIALPDGRRGWMTSTDLGVIDPRHPAPR